MATILVVDDCISVTTLARQILIDFGHIVEELNNSSELFEKIKQHHFDLILLDIYMPGDDGVTLLDKIKKQPEYKHIQVIMISAISDEHIITRCLTMGAVDYIVKPFNGLMLARRVELALKETAHTDAIKRLNNSEAQLARSQARYNAIIQASVDGIISVDSKGLITMFNPAATRLFGYFEDEMIGEKFSILMPGQQDEKYPSDFQEFMKTNMKSIIGKRHTVNAQRKDGSQFPTELSISKINYHGRKGFAAVVRDITERQQKEEEILKISEYLDNTLLNLPVGVAILEGEDFRYFRVNQYLADINQLPIEDHLGKKLIDIVPHAEESILPELRKVMKTGKSIIHREFSIKMQDHLKTLIDWHVPILRKKRELSAVVSVVLDISELRNTQEKLTQSQKLEALGTFAGGIAHDFNNSLAVIMGTSELLLETTDEKEIPKIRRILTAAKKAEYFVSQLLAFSRMETTQSEPQNLIAIANQALDMFSATFPSDISITTQFISHCPNVLGNEMEFHQIISNILTNAHHAMEGKDGKLKVSITKSEQHVFLKIKDTGKGIPLEIQSKIYDPFFTSKVTGKGTGLGLSIAYTLVKKHHGSIDFETNSSGTTFTISFPICTASVVEQSNNISDHPIEQASILIVDDNSILIDVYKEQLELAGYQISTRESGPKALALLKQNPSKFDLVLTDQAMPEMSGLQLAKEIQINYPKVAVILTSGYSETLNEENIKKYGIKRFLAKPVKSEVLTQAVFDVLSQE